VRNLSKDRARPTREKVLWFASFVTIQIGGGVVRYYFPVPGFVPLCQSRPEPQAYRVLREGNLRRGVAMDPIAAFILPPVLKAEERGTLKDPKGIRCPGESCFYCVFVFVSEEVFREPARGGNLANQDLTGSGFEPVGRVVGQEKAQIMLVNPLWAVATRFVEL
jgi:hypothetical protein